jgi:predicted sugar kinase
MWLTKLKIALVEKDIDRLSELMENIPKLESVQEMTEALYLTKEAKELLHRLKDETSFSMKQIKQNLNFLKSTQEPKQSKLDIKS